MGRDFRPKKIYKQRNLKKFGFLMEAVMLFPERVHLEVAHQKLQDGATSKS